MDKKHNEMHHQDNTGKEDRLKKKLSRIVEQLLTLPQEDLDGFEFLSASPASSSAKPQLQSLQAFLFPVVPQTVHVLNIVTNET